jgi:glucokinase
MNPTLPALMTGEAIGIDIGGTKINGGTIRVSDQAALQANLGTVYDLQNLATPTKTEPFLEALTTIIANLKNTSKPPIQCVGISTAGMVDPNRGMILGSTGNLPAVIGPFNLKATLEERTGLKVHVENDANAAAYGEYRAGAAQGYRNVLMITLGTGVGGGVVVEGKLVQGAHFSGGEVGHIAIGHDKKRQCTCGRWDCWEAYASGTGLALTTREMLKSQAHRPEVKALLKDDTIEEIGTHALIAAVGEKNPFAIEIMDLWHEHIAVGLGSIMNVLDPEMVVIGGGMAQFVDFEKLKKALSQRVMVPIESVHLEPAVLGNHAGMIGAAFLALEHLN